MKALVLLILASFSFATCDPQVGPRKELPIDKRSSVDMPDAPLNANEWFAASNILSRAGQLIDELGFQQGATEEVRQRCVATALESAFREGGYSIVDFNYARDALAQELGIPREPPVDLEGALAVPYWGRLFMEWNDMPGRTEEEAIELFEKASTRALDLRNAALRESGSS